MEHTHQGEQHEVLTFLQENTSAGEPLLSFAGCYLSAMKEMEQTAATTEELARFIEERFHSVQELWKGERLLSITHGLPSSSFPGDVSIVDVVMGNRPFIIESVLGLLQSQEISPTLFIRYTSFVRQTEGQFEHFYSKNGSPRHSAEVEDESENLTDICICTLLFESINAERTKKLRELLLYVLTTVSVVTEDFSDMLQMLDSSLVSFGEREWPEEKREYGKECVNFLRWLKDHNFILAGSAFVESNPEGGDIVVSGGKGIFRERSSLQSLKKEVCPHDPDRLQVYVSDRRGMIPRHENLLYLQIPKGEEQVNGFILIAGLFTTSARHCDAISVPFVRIKVRHVLESTRYLNNSYDYKRHFNYINSVPLEELFSLSEDMIRKIVSFLQEREHARRNVEYTLLYDEREQLLSAVVSLEDGAFSSSLFKKLIHVFSDEIEEKRLRAYYEYLQDGTVAIHFYGNIPPEGVDEKRSSLGLKIESFCQSWEVSLKEKILSKHLMQIPEAKIDSYISTLSDGYKSVVDSDMALTDFNYASLFQQSEHRVYVYVDCLEADGLSVRLYSDEELTLSRIMPVLNSFRFEVKHSDHYTLRLSGHAAIQLTTFTVRHGGKLAEDLDLIRENIVESMKAQLNFETNVDPLNELILSINASPQEVDLLRCYRNLLVQYRGNLVYSSIDSALLNHPDITRLTLDFFSERFDPSGNYADIEQRLATLKEMSNDFNTKLLEVKGIQDDRILRSLKVLIDATVRTSLYQTEGRLFNNTIALKIDSSQIPFLGTPVPYREIFVYSTDMEGIHIRGGQVARGGLRWSDRSDDYRTEILGLMKTQMVKNVVIVPVGAKGGFIVKRHGGNASADLRELGVQCYKKFISGMLDLTDNYGDDKTQLRPSNMVIYDDFDPYLVVAADKGTASFSDIANDISEQYNFWLKDAFASGGSKGYNHKEMGITARGAWECAKKHFRELGVDIQEQSVRVVGIGDMSGDVFGNGMLLSRKIKLVGAFNHLHIFIDPNPEDPEASYEERNRLFELTRSSWTDYNPKLISKGGGVFERGAKSITLSSEMKTLLKTCKDKVNGEELISLLLRAPVDMLFNGGIGTYVKASTESHAQVDDKANDNVRVDGKSLRVRVIVEGGNLGVTQKGRIEFEANGGIINSDAIDNSAGVDTSDHEVNLKILIEQIKACGKVNDAEGHRLLEHASEYVATRVLRHNVQQTSCLSMEQMRYNEESGELLDLILSLEEEGLLHREDDHIPSDGEIERMQQSSGIPRSLLAYLLGLEKIRVFDAIKDSPLVDNPYFLSTLIEYFPPELQERYSDEIQKHPLRREIIATILVNRVVNRGGLSFIHSLEYQALASVPDIVSTYFFVDAILDSEQFRRHIFALERSVPSKTLYEMLINYEGVIYKMVRWTLQQQLRQKPAQREETSFVNKVTSWFMTEEEESERDFVNFEQVECYREKILNYFKEYFIFLAEVDPHRYQLIHQEIEELKENNVPEVIARQSAYSVFLKPALGLIGISEETGVSLHLVAQSNILIAERFHINYLHSYLKTVPVKNEWDKVCFSSLETSLYYCQDQLVNRIIQSASHNLIAKKGEGGTQEDMTDEIHAEINAFIASRSLLMSELDKIIVKLKKNSDKQFAPVVVIEKLVVQLVK